ncbi:hypothetical protein MN608_08466 [Microdochium nivale]|nr:hypothetical protein MN608_08466 [Microdochium nivale]
MDFNRLPYARWHDGSAETMLQIASTRQLMARIVVSIAACLVLWEVLALRSLDNGSLPDVASLSPFQVLDDSLDTTTLDFVCRANKNVYLNLSRRLLYTTQCFTPSKDSAVDCLAIEHIEKPLIANHLEVRRKMRPPPVVDL